MIPDAPPFSPPPPSPVAPRDSGLPGLGLLMTIAVVPVIFTLRMSRQGAAISVGMLLWIAGGLALLVVPNDVMGTAQRFIHIAEILTQNALLGITAVLLLRPRPATLARSAVVA